MDKRIIFLTIFPVFFLFSWATPDEIILNVPGEQHDHIQYYLYADQPDVYYDSDLEVIIIDGGGEVGYYDVVIESATNFVTVISTQVSGYYDTIDVSSLTADEYIITISSPTGNDFEGFFEIE